MSGEIAPNITRALVLREPGPAGIGQFTILQALAPSLNVELRPFELRDAASNERTIGLQIQIIRASTSSEIDAAFAMLSREKPDALFVVNDPFFNTRRVQIALLQDVMDSPRFLQNVNTPRPVD